MRDQEDCNEKQDMTLTGRISRLEKILDVNRDPYGNLQQRTNVDRDPVVSFRDVDKVEMHREQARPQPPNPSALEDIINRIQSVTDRVCMVSAKLEEIGNRVFGPLPEQDGEGAAVRANPDGTLDHTYLALNWLDQALCRLHSAAARLERV